MRGNVWCWLGLGLLGATGVRSAAPSRRISGMGLPAVHPRARRERALDNVAPLHVPGSSARFTAADVAKGTVAPDWFPREHLPLPADLAASHSDKFACAYCHLPDGSGRPENAKLAGLSRSYIFAQVRALHIGERQPGKAGWPPTVLMQAAVADLTDTQILAAADYFSRQKNVSFVRVLEREFAPAHKVACGIYVPDAGRLVPVKHSIVEMPVDAQRRFGNARSAQPSTLPMCPRAALSADASWQAPATTAAPSHARPVMVRT